MADHITPILKSLHWLPVSYRIDFKSLLLVCKSLNGFRPKYISNMLAPYEPTRSLRSSEGGFLIVLRVRTKCGEAAFAHYATKNWNKLPDDLRSAPSITVFKSRLKTFQFCLPF